MMLSNLQDKYISSEVNEENMVYRGVLSPPEVSEKTRSPKEFFNLWTKLLFPQTWKSQ